MQMKKISFFRLFVFGATLVMLSGPAWTGELPAVESGEIIISQEKITLLRTSARTYTPDNLFQAINGQAEQYLAYGFIDLKTAQYTDSQKKSLHVTVELYRMKNPLAAFGIYSSGRFEGAQFIGRGTEGFLSDPMLFFFKGDYYVKISCFADTPQRQSRALEQIATAVDNEITGKARYPPEIGFLTRAGINPRTIYFGEKGLLGYDFLPPGFQMKHTAKGENLQLFAAVCPDVLQAQEALRSYLGAMRIEHRNIQERVFDSVKMWEIDDPYHGKVIIMVKEKTLAGIKEAPQDLTAGLELLRKIAFAK